MISKSDGCSLFAQKGVDSSLRIMVESHPEGERPSSFIGLYALPPVLPLRVNDFNALFILVHSHMRC